MADTEDTETPAVESRVIIEIDEHPQLVGATGTIKKFSNDGTTAWVETGPSLGVWCSVSNLRVIPPGHGGVMADTEDTETLIAELSRFRKSGVGLSPVGAKTAATAVLASSWLAARDERIRADEREKLAAVEALVGKFHESVQAVVNNDAPSIRHREVLRSVVMQLRAALNPAQGLE